MRLPSTFLKTLFQNMYPPNCRYFSLLFYLMQCSPRCTPFVLSPSGLSTSTNAPSSIAHLRLSVAQSRYPTTISCHSTFQPLISLPFPFTVYTSSKPTTARFLKNHPPFQGKCPPSSLESVKSRPRDPLYLQHVWARSSTFFVLFDATSKVRNPALDDVTASRPS